ncbi:MAG TPA: metallophosphoesterase, partial [Vicinamibacterales bacterium]|nr:metallophosphoesterase [Vicinamibacterales bacterium]
MKYLVISDIHANLEALDAVLAAAGPYDHALVLGDLVGYGADPNAVIDRVRALPSATLIRGNHDKVGAGLENTDGFNYLARHAIEWTANALTPDHHDWLAALPQGPVVVDDLVEICHGTPFDEDVYIFDDLDAMRALHVARRPLCLFGHTHVVAAFHLAGETRSVGHLRSTQI